MNPRLVGVAAAAAVVVVVVVVVVEVFEVVEVVEAVSATFGALCSMLLIFGDAVVVVAPIPSSGVLELLLVVWHLFAFQSMFEKTNPKRHQWTEQPWSARELTLRGPFWFVAAFVRCRCHVTVRLPGAGAGGDSWTSASGLELNFYFEGRI